MRQDKVYKALLEMEVPMVDPEIIRQVREFTRFKWGSKRIAAELGLARNTVRRYQRLPVELMPVQQRPGGRRLDVTARSRAQQLLSEEAEGNAVVVRRLLIAEGQQASLRTVQRAVMMVRQELRRRQVATVRFGSGFPREAIRGVRSYWRLTGLTVPHGQPTEIGKSSCVMPCKLRSCAILMARRR